MNRGRETERGRERRETERIFRFKRTQQYNTIIVGLKAEQKHLPIFIIFTICDFVPDF